MKLGPLAKRLLPRPALERLLPRHLQAFCIGTPKSGTTSVAGLFLSGCRGDHEPLRRWTVAQMHAHSRGDISDATYVRYLRQRDRKLWLEIESNCFMGYRPDLVAEAFPAALFVLTIRDPTSWLRSMLDNHLDYAPRVGSDMEKWHEVFFASHPRPHAGEETALADRDLYPVRTYLDYWVAHNRSALEALGDRHMMVLGTQQISPRAESIAAFLDVNADQIDRKASHKNVTPVRHGMLDQLEPAWLTAQIEASCGDFIDEFGLDAVFRGEPTGC